jgi:periplasmic protein TonB
MPDRKRWLWIVCFLLSTAIPMSCRAESDAVAEWKRKISAQLVAHKRFPPSLMGRTGEATVKFTLDRSGKLTSNEVLKSSGIPQFDSAALEMVESSQPFPQAPPEASDLSFRLPVVFEKRRPLAGGDVIGNDDGLLQEKMKVDSKMRGICRGC